MRVVAQQNEAPLLQLSKRKFFISSIRKHSLPFRGNMHIKTISSQATNSININDEYNFRIYRYSFIWIVRINGLHSRKPPVTWDRTFRYHLIVCPQRLFSFIFRIRILRAIRLFFPSHLYFFFPNHFQLEKIQQMLYSCSLPGIRYKGEIYGHNTG